MPLLTVSITQRYRMGRMLSCYMICWGAVVLCIGFAQNFKQLIVLRALQGAFEVGWLPKLKMNLIAKGKTFANVSVEVLHLSGLYARHRVLVHNPRARVALARLPECWLRLWCHRPLDPLRHRFGAEVTPGFSGLAAYVFCTFLNPIFPPTGAGVWYT